MESRELDALDKAEKLIALLKEDEELRKKLKSDILEERQSVLEKIDLKPEQMESFLSALEMIYTTKEPGQFW